MPNMTSKTHPVSPAWKKAGGEHRKPDIQHLSPAIPNYSLEKCRRASSLLREVKGD